MGDTPKWVDSDAAASYLREKHGIPIAEKLCATGAPLARIAALPAGILALNHSMKSQSSIAGRTKMLCNSKTRCGETCVYARPSARDRRAVLR